MKKILQALDGASTKPVEGSNEMAKFMTIVNEGANPHNVSLPVQMAMQHYQSTEEKKPTIQNESGFKKYLKLVEDELVQEKEERRAQLNQYASIIAERVMKKK